MAAVTLQGLYLAPVTDLSLILRLNASLDLADDIDSRVEFVSFAQGRIRMVTRPGESRVLPIQVGRIDRATREELHARSGVLQLLRDGRGRKVYGAYGTPRFTESRGPAYSSVTLQFVQVSHDESV